MNKVTESAVNHRCSMAKKRKTPTSYNLSADSVKSGAEFGYASRLASVLKNALTPLVFDQYGNALHKRLQAKITAAIARGPEAGKGNRIMADGDVALLKGVELNPYTPFASLVFVPSVRATILPETNAIRVELPAIGPDAFNWPERAQEAYIHVRCIVTDVRELAAEIYALEPLVFRKAGAGNPPRQATVNTTDLEDRMVLVAIGISFSRTDSEGRDGLVSRNRKYYAARIVQACYVKDGKVVVFVEGDKKPDPLTSSSVSSVATIKWDDGEA